MKKITVVRANPRKTGHTQTLTDLFIDGLRQGETDVRQIDITTKTINHCLGCYNCWLITPGTCVHSDDMSAVMDEFCSSDIVVFSTPLYIYGISSYLKTFLDRLLPYMKNEHAQTATGNIRNLIRDPDRWPKKMAYILVGSFRGTDTFDGARKSLELFSEGLNLPLCGSIVRPESYFLPFTYLKPKTVRLVKAAFTAAGSELARTGTIQPETIRQASAPLAETADHFIKDSNIYWQEAERLGQRSSDLDYVSYTVMRNPYILVSEMARNISPRATARLKAVIQFTFTDKNQRFTLTVDHGSCTYQETSVDAPDLHIMTTAETWAGIFLREINAAHALKDGSIKLEGDKSLFIRLDKYFPLPFD